jgi:hypothetical protein
VRSVGTLPNIPTWTLGKAKRTSKEPQSLLPTATIALYHNLLECCQVLLKIFSISIDIKNLTAAGFGYLFKQKMLRRVRQKRLNTAAGLFTTRAKN